MNVRDLRRKYLEFFESKGHTRYPSGSLVPYDVTGRLDESLLFNGAGMVQFKPFFRGVAEPPNRRLATAQKCVRTGDIESVGDLSHLTFFEMMGNFSFGDYFKAEAIEFSWEFLTDPRWLGLEPARLAFTVFEEDDEAYRLWALKLEPLGIDPSTRIFRLGEETNYWPAGSFSSGPPGPCGPNTEMFYWTSTEPAPITAYTREDFLRDESEGRWLEVWNDVFIQYDWQGVLKDPSRPDLGYQKTGMPDLPFQSVDTGMGLERTAAVLGGKSSVYDTDAFQPLIRLLESLRPGLVYGSDKKLDTAIRVIADHSRTACFCLADGILPSNTGRGYVLRRLIRRAVLKGRRTLGIEQPFLHRVPEGVAAAMGDYYTELYDRMDTLVETLRGEEALFRRTLEQGSEMLDRMLGSCDRVLPGEDAFRLYDTYGFPLEVTQEITAERGFEVDVEGFRQAMSQAQDRSRGASGMDTVYGGVVVTFQFEPAESGLPRETEFVGSEHTTVQAKVVGVLPVEEDGSRTGELVFALDRTPFYVEAGGQVEDTGTLTGEGFEVKVQGLDKQDGVVVHLGEPLRWEGLPDPLTASPEALNRALFGEVVTAQVDRERRAAITRNHTATHLLHAALRSVLGKHVTQAGSMVGPESLRFDFTHGQGLTPEQLDAVEDVVNRAILEAHPVAALEGLSMDQARALGAIALFGEKYSDEVRMVQIGGLEPNHNPVSRELCGGVHVRNTGEIGLFKIISEGSVASGVRRVEAVTGWGSIAWLREQQAQVRQASALLKSNPSGLVGAVERLLESLREERKKRERLASQGAGQSATTTMVGSVELLTEKLDGADPKDAQRVADRLAEGHPNRVTLVATVSEGKASFVCKVGEEALRKGAHAGNLLREVAKLAGGGGGGKPDFATAGGKQPEKLPEALDAAGPLLAAMLKG